MNNNTENKSNELKTFILGYNTYDHSVVVYSNEKDAQERGGFWKTIQAENLKDATTELLIEYGNWSV